MIKRLLGTVLLAGSIAIALPAMAMASLPHPTFSGVKHTYIVKHGANLTVTGKVKGKASTKHWDQHAPFEIEKLVKGRWVDLLVFRPKANGKFKVTLRKPSHGTYRVRYDGCEHYSRASRVFHIKGGSAIKPIVESKLDPQLSVTGVERAPLGTALKPQALDPVIWDFTAVVHTGLPAEAMAGTHLTITALGSISGATYTVVYTVPTPSGFSGSQAVTVGPIPVPINDGVSYFSDIKIKADWAGNEFTNAGSASSDPFSIEY